METLPSLSRRLAGELFGESSSWLSRESRDDDQCASVGEVGEVGAMGDVVEVRWPVKRVCGAPGMLARRLGLSVISDIESASEFSRSPVENLEARMKISRRVCTM